MRAQSATKTLGEEECGSGYTYQSARGAAHRDPDKDSLSIH